MMVWMGGVRDSRFTGYGMACMVGRQAGLTGHHACLAGLSAHSLLACSLCYAGLLACLLGLPA